MTGETLAGLGSSAAILYYNDFVTYPDNTTEPTDLLLAPLPHTAGTATPLMPQAGVGLCAFKTTDQKAEAAAVFLRWLTEQQRNLEFAANTGYMPVSSACLLYTSFSSRSSALDIRRPNMLVSLSWTPKMWSRCCRAMWA